MARQMTELETVTVFLPDGHPLVGSTLDIYPQSGATSYKEGQLVFTSHAYEFTRDLRTTLGELREELAQVQAEWARRTKELRRRFKDRERLLHDCSANEIGVAVPVELSKDVSVLEQLGDALP